MRCSDVNATAASSPSRLGGRSDLGGKQTRRPEDDRMTAAPKSYPYGSRGTDHGVLPSLLSGGEGRCSLGSNGYVHQGKRRGRGPGIWGKSCGDNAGKDHLAAGTDDNLQRPRGIGTTEATGRNLVWRMSS